MSHSGQMKKKSIKMWGKKLLLAKNYLHFKSTDCGNFIFQSRYWFFIAASCKQFFATENKLGAVKNYGLATLYYKTYRP